ncbi:MAG: hypothetical protein J6C96_07605, partial [Oscillospiraceae bacterium]|nr:hypothetical protein [Oscillospiraceae bacterium]
IRPYKFSFVQNSPPDCFEEKLLLLPNKGRRSLFKTTQALSNSFASRNYSCYLKCCRIFHPLLRFFGRLRAQAGVSRFAERDQRAFSPLDT